MHRLLLATLATLALAAPAGAATIKDDVIGCKDKDDMSKVYRLMRQGDKDAFIAFLTPRVVTGECTTFDKGQTVFLDDVAMFSGAACVRPKGNPDCFYVIIEGVDGN